MFMFPECPVLMQPWSDVEHMERSSQSRMTSYWLICAYCSCIQRTWLTLDKTGRYRSSVTWLELLDASKDCIGVNVFSNRHLISPDLLNRKQSLNMPLPTSDICAPVPSQRCHRGSFFIILQYDIPTKLIIIFQRMKIDLQFTWHWIQSAHCLPQAVATTWQRFAGILLDVL